MSPFLHRTTFLHLCFLFSLCLHTCQALVARYQEERGVSYEWLDTKLPIDVRLEALVKVMTPEEKVAQLLSSHLIYEETERFLEKYSSVGFGVALPCQRIKGPPKSFAPPTVKECLEWRNEIQRNITLTSRLGIPISFREELLHSAGIPNATVFPMPVNIGATWNLSLAREVFSAIASEARAGGVDYGFAPVLQVATNSLWGRGQEAFGADPTLVAQFADAVTRSLQGDPVNTSLPSTFNASNRIVCQGKHFFAYGAMAHDTVPVDLSERTLREVYLKPWRSWVRDSGGLAVMATHPPVNGCPMVANRRYLTDVLRGDLGGENTTVASDNGDVSHLFSTWKVASSIASAGALAVSAGLDQELIDGIDSFAVEAAHRENLLEPGALDRAARNVLRLKFVAGLFDAPNDSFGPDPDDAERHLQLPRTRALSLESAAQSAVLLLNKDGEGNGLPLSALAAHDYSGNILLVGPNAGCSSPEPTLPFLCSARTALVGGYAPQGGRIPTIEEAVREYYGTSSSSSSAGITFSQGASACVDPDPHEIERAVNLVEKHDVVVVAVGDTGDKDPVCKQCGEGKDRTSLDLSGGQLELLERVLDAASAAKGRTIPVVVVLIHGRPVTFGGRVSSLNESSSSALLNHNALTALIAGWRPGPYGPRALWELIVGRRQFSGKLTQPWPANAGQVVSASSPWFQYPLRGGGISDMFAFGEPQAPLFTFAHGLIPNTAFRFSNVQVEESKGTRGTFRVRVRVANEGTRSGSALVAVFASPPIVPLVSRFRRTLIGWNRVLVDPGEEVVVDSIYFDAEKELSRWDEDRRAYVVDEGVYQIFVGDCSTTGVLPAADARCTTQAQASFAVKPVRS